MPNSNYPKGFANGLNVRGLPILNTYPGKVFWVDSVNGSNGNKGTFDRPWAGLDFAISHETVKTNRGDVIMLKAKHAETLSAADAIDADKIGIAIVGVGTGSNMPTFTMDDAAGEFTIGANNVTVAGIKLLASVTAVLKGFNIEDGINNTSLIDVVLAVDSEGTDEFLHGISMINNNTGTLIENADIDMGVGGGATAAIIMDADTIDTVIRGCDIRGDYSVANIEGNTTLSKDVLIEKNLLVNGTSGTLIAQPVIELLTGTTGMIRDNDMVCNVATPDLAIVADTCMRQNNSYSETVNAEGSDHAVPAADGTVNLLSRDVVGNKSDAGASGAVSTTESLMAYGKQAITEIQVMDALIDTAADLQAKVTEGSTAVMVNNDDIFTISGGLILIESLVSVCISGNDGTASTLQYEVDPTTGVAVTISNASASLASAVAGATVSLQGTALTTAALLNASGGNLGMSANGLVANVGVISVVIGVGSTTGTWKHFLRWRPLETGAAVVGI